MSAVSHTDICLTSAAGQAAGQTSASSVMLRVHCLTGFDMGIRGCQGQQLQIDAGSSLNRKEQKRENYTFWRQSIEKSSNVPGCPDGSSISLVKGSGHKGSAKQLMRCTSAHWSACFWQGSWRGTAPGCTRGQSVPMLLGGLPFSCAHAALKTSA